MKSATLGSYWFAGAKWWYERPAQGPEYLMTSGVIATNVSVYIISNHAESSVRFTAGIPPVSASHYRGNYSWVSSNWSACDALCGDGVMGREVQCVRGEGEEGGVKGEGVEDVRCVDVERPVDVKECRSDICLYQWRAGQWGQCIGECGEGERKRTVECLLTNNGTIVNTSFCSSEEAPESVSVCHTLRGCHYEWKAGGWSKCSSICGEGQRTRNISCLLANNGSVVDTRYCETNSTPETVSPCGDECSYKWRIRRWRQCIGECGEGERKRTVECLITNNGTIVNTSFCSSEEAPESVSVCHTLRGCHYEWKAGGWSKCSSICGEGQRTRNISCLLANNGSVVDTRYCETNSTPETVSPCGDECSYKWRVGQWGQCIGECGEGERKRRVECLLTNNHTVVNRSFCSSEEAPESVSVCHTLRGCRYEWKAGGWSKCSSICGEGQRTRNISCLLANNGSVVDTRYCETNSTPETVSPCGDECSYKWRVGQWEQCIGECGEGERKRRVECLLTNNHTVVNRSFCSSEEAPESVSVCHTLRGCRYEWKAGGWSKCSSICGEGQRTRNISCLLANNGSVVDTRYCETNSTPETVSPCRDECSYKWRVGEWGGCEGGSCEGVRRRNITCVLVNDNSVVADSYCDPKTTPTDSADCQPEECRYEWRTEKWGGCSVGCGEGVRVREVYCVLVNGAGGSRRVISGCDNSSILSESEQCSDESCSNFYWMGGEWSEVSHKEEEEEEEEEGGEEEEEEEEED